MALTPWMQIENRMMPSDVERPRAERSGERAQDPDDGIERADPDRASALSLTSHWIIVYACVPLVVILSFTTLRMSEAPARASVERAR